MGTSHQPARASLALLALTAGVAVSCAGTRPDDIGLASGRLAPCPSSPNCVSSDGPPDDEQHFVAALELAVDGAAAWTAARAAVESLPGTKIVSADGGYLHAECTSRLMRYVDDLELDLRAVDGVIAVRSASRVGRGDMGVNRRRVEALRAKLGLGGVVRGDVQ